MTGYSSCFLLLQFLCIFALWGLSSCQDSVAEVRIISIEADVMVSCRCINCLFTRYVNFTSTFINDPDREETQTLENNLSGPITIRDITPLTERRVRCRGGVEGSDTQFSEPVTLAALPSLDNPSDRIHNLLAVENLTVTLECPFVLGVARNELSPYKYAWLEISGEQIAMQSMRNYSVQITSASPNKSTYYCGVYMTRCSICNSPEILPASNDERARFTVTKVDKVSIEMPPIGQTVNESSPVSFNCSASGTKPEITWRYNGVECYTGQCSSGVMVSNCTLDHDVCSSIDFLSVAENFTIECCVHQTFGEQFSNMDVVEQLNSYEDCKEAPLIVIPQPEPTTVTATSEPQGVSETIVTAVIVLGVLAILAIAIVIIVLCAMYCHYSYKYKSESSRLGRFLSRAMSRPQTTQLYSNREMNQLPSDGNGCVPASCFQSTQSIIHPSSHEQEQIYNTSQHSNASGGSYSGLSGVSNQEPGASYKMPAYAATEISGASYYPSSSVTNGGLLAPISASNRSPRHSDTSTSMGRQARASNNATLTQELLSKHQQENSGSANLQLFDVTPDFHTTENFGQASRGFNSQPPHAEPTMFEVPVSTYSHVPFPCNNTGPQAQQAPFPHEQLVRTENISKETIETVMNCLMHNRNCLIPNCPCYVVRRLYHKNISAKPTGRPTSLFNKQQSSTTSSSGSETNSDKRSKLFLPLSSQDDGNFHPHYHPGTRARSKSIYLKTHLARRRSKSLDLTPVDIREDVSSPVVGGTLFPETPVCAPKTFERHLDNPDEDLTKPEFKNGELSPADKKLSTFKALSRQNSQQLPVFSRIDSMSADDIPILCLNDCPFTSKPARQVSVAGKPTLPTVAESQQVSPAVGIAPSVSSSVLSQPIHKITSQHSTEAKLSETSFSSLKPAKRSLSGSNNSLRSASPAYQTVVSVSDNGSTIHMTEC